MDMALTLFDVKERMARGLSELDILEVLEITTEDLVERFEDRILDKVEELVEELETEGEENEVQ